MERTGIALNVGRSRMNLLAIVLAVDLFSTSTYISLAHSFDVPALWVFLNAFVPLILGFAVTLLALLVFLGSQRLDREGLCDPLAFSIGELLMYLAMALTLGGALQGFVGGIGSIAAANAGSGLAGTLYLSLLTACALIWGGILYVAPALFLWRTPLPARRKATLGAGYAIALLLLASISANAFLIKARAAGDSPGVGGAFLRQLWQPMLWDESVAELLSLQQRRFGSMPGPGEEER